MSTQKSRHSEASTTESLLNAAERLFAKYGYDGVGMRALADEAGVNLGATTYHYGSKEKLYIETVMRRFRPIGEERIRSLRQAEKAASGKPIPVETIVDCMLRPPFMTVLAHPYFPALLARNLFMPPPFMQEFMAKENIPFTEPFVAALARTLPNLPPQVLYMRDMFAGGILLMVSSQLSKMPMRKSPDFCELVLKDMVTFIAAGLRTESTISGSDLPPMAFSRPLCGTDD
ncbi:TetR/AcrR family transcriptional regulator [Geobacter sp. FeAm09]|uniref:TetR/AcrR family transcriptional regulator n=1 Tax=Geobacter sp. FeAm09 TaxID=2597769 RepID=UPI0011F0420F|nr:TetR/AcrR family transcriptional regulator [Geobacter sp. FeAm09]QEM68926.1 TetR/AcrR family transcriptional regulator [Geobacter sp. FeAm09]